jgi:hypothetical protein
LQTFQIRIARWTMTLRSQNQILNLWNSYKSQLLLFEFDCFGCFDCFDCFDCFGFRQICRFSESKNRASVVVTVISSGCGTSSRETRRWDSSVRDFRVETTISNFKIILSVILLEVVTKNNDTRLIRGLVIGMITF